MGEGAESRGWTMEMNIDPDCGGHELLFTGKNDDAAESERHSRNREGRGEGRSKEGDGVRGSIDRSTTGR